jgi:hypothetical protein
VSVTPLFLCISGSWSRKFFSRRCPMKVRRPEWD